MPSKDKIKVVLFSGGRGASSIAAALIEHPQIDLTVLVNAYDDGLSTGRLRAYIPGMLGPSDIRKNITTLMPTAERCHRALKGLLEYRLPFGTSRTAALESLKLFSDKPNRSSSADPFIVGMYKDLSVNQLDTIINYCAAFMQYEAMEQSRGCAFDYGDCSIGNILFSGCYLQNGNDFNKTVAEFSKFSEARGTVLNITDGRNFILVGVKGDGRVLHNEAAIVSPQDGPPVEEIFLLDDYLSNEELTRVSQMPKAVKLGYFREHHRVPDPNPQALQAIEQADLIIYGPGTQFSSLLPSYLTAGVAEAIVANVQAEKVFVSNIVHDHDIQGQAVQEILDAFLYSMTRKGIATATLPQLITTLFVQNPDRANINHETSSSYVPYDVNALAHHVVKATDWESSSGRHAGGQIVDEMLTIVQRLVDIRITPFRHMVSIIVPALNEARTVGKVLKDLKHLDLSPLNMSKEIIFVDGGSTDSTLDIARTHKHVRVYSLNGARGRGEALKLGLSKARGNVIVFFPADDEYDTSDILPVAEPIIKNQFHVVFGSRMIKCVDLRARIRQIYGEKNRLAYLMSKYGGMAVSILSLLLYNRFVSDPFSTLKAFDGSILKSMALKSSGVELDAEIIAKISRRRLFILEVPVQFRPRSRAQGKKTRMRDGMKFLFTLAAGGFRSFETAVSKEDRKTWANSSSYRAPK